MKKCDWGWQGEAKKLRIRAEYLLMNLVNLPIPADVTFEFDKDGSLETVSAHKIFLAIGSEVFMAMFYGPSADPAQTKVLIPNYSKTAFEALIHYLYSDRIPDSLTDLEDDGLWMELLECAMQYGVPELATKCRVAIADRLVNEDDADVCKILAEAKRLDEPEIEQAAWRELDTYTIGIVSKSRDISRELLAEIVQRSELNIEGNQEIELYDAVRQWAIIQNGRDEKSTEPCPAVCEHCEHCIRKKDPVRQQLGPVFQHIRFPLMSPDQLANGPIKDSIFTSAELSHLFALKLPGNAPPLLPDAYFSSSPRQTRLGIDVVDLHFEYRPKEISGIEENDIGWTTLSYMTVVPDWDTCPDTSRRFMKLCEEKYEFAIVAQYHTILEYPQPAEFAVDPNEAIQELFLPLVTSENSLMHDSGGTVSLCLAKNENDEGSYYQLFISPDKKIANTGTVFGRLVDWSADLHMLKTLAHLSEMIECDLRVVTVVNSLEPYEP